MQLASAYATQHPALRPFYAHPWHQPDWRAIAEARDRCPTPRATLVQVLRTQYADLPARAATARNLDRLAQADTLTVTTGQQPALFGGPLYNFYKALTTVALAQQAEAALNRPVIPVFWVASEDHDRDELDHTWIDFLTCLRYPDLGSGPVGRHVLGPAIDHLTDRTGPTRTPWQPGRTWATAYRLTLDALLGDRGLIVLDADDRRLKAAAAPLWAAELSGQGIYGPVMTQTEALRQAGFAAQLQPRPINLFWIENELRERIEADTPAGFRTAEGSRRWSAAELEAALADKPEAFSPNAALRPLYQETLLPNLAYIGGWGEIAYWMQLRQAFGPLPMPVLVPRLQARLWTPAQERRRLALGLPREAVAWSENQLTEHFARRLRPEALPEGWPDRLQSVWRELEDWLAAQAPEHLAGARGQALRQHRYLRQLVRRLDRRALRQHPRSWLAALDLKRSLEPEGRVQERTLNLLAWPGLNTDRLANRLLERWQLGRVELLDVLLEESD